MRCPVDRGEVFVRSESLKPILTASAPPVLRAPSCPETSPALSNHVQRIFCRGLLVPALCLVAMIGRADEKVSIGSPSILLKLGDQGSTDHRQTAAWADAGMRSTLLVRYGRLLPDGLPEATRQQLAAFLQDSDAAADSATELLAQCPLADELVFDGQRYAGANFSYIDSILGKSGRPVAFDRALPAVLVPLPAEAEKALAESREKFQASEESRAIREATAKSQGEVAATALFADGQFLRPYAGRFDDLYFHLYQNGNGASAMAFGALVDGLAQRRTYLPVYGVCQKSKVPALGYDFSDILSDGGKAAVSRHLHTRYERPIEPFRGFAFRLLPNIIGRARTLPAGARFTASTDEILQTLRARQHFYPIQVPALYRSPDRFLGWAGSLFIPVANHPALPPGAAESWYPLPQRGGRAPADAKADGASSAQLFESSSVPDLPGSAAATWEDPQLSNLLGGPETKAQPPVKPAAPGASSSGDAADPRVRNVATRLVAVITPTNQEAGDYLSAIAASDKDLRELECSRGRGRLLRQFIESAHPVAQSKDGIALPGDLQRALTADLAALDRYDAEFDRRVQEALEKRAALRTDLEARLNRDRVRPLEAMGKKSEESGKSADRLSL